MARAGINLVLVQQAKNALLARGVRPTIDAVRIELGNTGSKSTIQRYLKALSEQPSPTPPPTLLEELQQLLAPVAERLQHAAHDAVADERNELTRDQMQYRNQRQLQLERLQQLQTSNSELNQQLSDQRQREHQLLAQQQRNAVELQRLQQAELGQAQLVAAQVEQLHSLEEKHRHARDALEHYQVQQQQLRERELQRHEAQLRQVQLELHLTQLKTQKTERRTQRGHFKIRRKVQACPHTIQGNICCKHPCQHKSKSIPMRRAGNLPDQWITVSPDFAAIQLEPILETLCTFPCLNGAQYSPQGVIENRLQLRKLCHQGIPCPGVGTRSLQPITALLIGFSWLS